MDLTFGQSLVIKIHSYTHQYYPPSCVETTSCCSSCAVCSFPSLTVRCVRLNPFYRVMFLWLRCWSYFSLRSLPFMSFLSLRPAWQSGQYARMSREGDSIGVQHLKHDWTRQEQNVGSWLHHSMTCCVGCGMVRNIALTESGTVAPCVRVDKDPSVPSPEDFLDEIRGLSVEVHYALRVLVPAPRVTSPASQRVRSQRSAVTSVVGGPRRS